MVAMNSLLMCSSVQKHLTGFLWIKWGGYYNRVHSVVDIKWYLLCSNESSDPNDNFLVIRIYPLMIKRTKYIKIPNKRVVTVEKLSCVVLVAISIGPFLWFLWRKVLAYFPWFSIVSFFSFDVLSFLERKRAFLSLHKKHPFFMKLGQEFVIPAQVLVVYKKH